MICDLCKLEIKTNVYMEWDSFIILDCKDCLVPMVVWKEHTMDVHESDQYLLEAFLKECAYQFYEGKEYYIDTKQNQILNHLHWHARPHKHPKNIPFKKSEKKA
jgi:diadenosine tetraphosphate (Ap4A) HIT family hydrolase|tara:strand:+ start:227 stop:538 length:312 start_codon:yes stop_codon:yes gene_type:complete